MLRKETVTPETLELLKNLMKDERLIPFTLVGGTALALQIAHRQSIDIDLFSKEGFDASELSDHLKANYRFTPDFIAKNTLKGGINGVKVDFITHAYPDASEPLHVEEVRMATLEDIAAMKLNAIIGSGSRVKDFTDIAYLSSYLSLKKMIQSYAAKYSGDNPAMALKALNFHNDINLKEPVHLLKGKFDWDKIVQRLREMTKEPDKIFTPMTFAEGKQRAVPKAKKRR